MEINKKEHHNITIFYVFKIILIFALFIFAITSLLKFTSKDAKTKEIVLEEVNGYVLKNTSSSYYKKLFSELKTILDSEYEKSEYAEIVAKLYVADFYSLSTAITKNDVGGIQYVYEPFRADFKKIAKDTIYSRVENNIYGDRKQELPIVTGVTVNSNEESTFKINNKKVDVVKINLQIEYKKDLGYHKEVELLLYLNNKKFEIVKMD